MGHPAGVQSQDGFIALGALSKLNGGIAPAPKAEALRLVSAGEKLGVGNSVSLMQRRRRDARRR